MTQTGKRSKPIHEGRTAKASNGRLIRDEYSPGRLPAQSLPGEDAGVAMPVPPPASGELLPRLRSYLQCIQPGVLPHCCEFAFTMIVFSCEKYVCDRALLNERQTFC